MSNRFRRRPGIRSTSIQPPARPQWTHSSSKECRSSQLRTIQNISFTGSSTLSFNLNYAADSFFVEIVYLYFKSATAVVVALVVLVSQLMSFHHPTPVVIITPRASNSPGCITSIPRRYLTARIGSVVVGSNFKVHSCSS